MQSPSQATTVVPPTPSSDHQQLLNICSTNPTLRFQLELEFVELLSNPHYLQYLAHSGYLKQPAFTAYIHYLQYWRTPAYSHYIQHPSALHFLLLLHTDGDALAEKLQSNEFVDLIHTEQYFSWRSNKFNRYKEWEGRRQAVKTEHNVDAHASAAVQSNSNSQQQPALQPHNAAIMDTG